MQYNQEHIEELIAGYLQGILTEEENLLVEEWKNQATEHQEIFNQSEKIWRLLQLLREMEQYDPEKSLDQVHRKLRKNNLFQFWKTLQKVAAVLIIPLLIATFWLSLRKTPPRYVADIPVWNTFSTPPGVKSMFYLPDSTAVWLNSASSITFPSNFSDEVRKVEVQGEVFFDVKKDNNKQFLVKLGKIHVRVHGTRFNVVNYGHEENSEIILVSGSVEICAGSCEQPRCLSLLQPGERAFFSKKESSLNIQLVDAEKHVSWINGLLVFRDDPMAEVIRKLNRWFNVEIEVADPVILEYIYTATFQDESIDQILELLALSAPIKYQIVQREKQENGTFTPKRIILKKRN